MEFDRRSAEMLFLTEREEKHSIAIAPDESLWIKTFTDPRLCAAIVNRRTLTQAAS